MARLKSTKKATAQPSEGPVVGQQSRREVECFDEDEVLLPVSNGSHPDDWPCFVLQDAVVLDKAGNFANLLNAEINGPLFVRGRLEVDKEVKHLRKIRDLKGAQVSVSGVSGFSMGTGPITIWALGNIRWFEINPAAEYQKMYKNMTDGVELYYFLVEAYETRRSKSKQTVSMDYILKEFSDYKGSPVTQEAFVELCSEHALFLFSQMQKPHEPVLWALTKFYKWLVEQCSDSYEHYKDGIKKGNVDTPPEILETLKDIYISGRHRREKLTIRQLSRAMFERFNFFSLILAQEFIRVNAESLLLELRVGWQEEDWQFTPLYLKLTEMLENPGKDNDLRQEATQLKLKRRIRGNTSLVPAIKKNDVHDNPASLIRQPRRSGLANSPSHDDTSSSGSRSDGQSLNQGRRMAAKGKGRQVSEDEDEDEEMPDAIKLNNSSEDEQVDSFITRRVSATPSPQSRGPVGPRRSGKKAALRLVKSDIIPQLPVLLSAGEEEDDDDDGRSRKRRKVSPSNLGDAESVDNSGTPIFGSEDDEGEGEEREEAEDVGLDFTLESEPLPSTTPQGSNGLWTCSRKGCHHTITKADESDGKSQVYEHLRKHANEIAARENLILKEAKGGLKVDHLLEKIRKMGEDARIKQQKTINGRVVPLPIQRRMLS